jgi:hypothetical protein
MDALMIKNTNLKTEKNILAFCDYLDENGYFKESDYILNKFAAFNAPRAGKKKKRWSIKYKKSIDCNKPKGFSQKQYCKRKRSGGDYKS